VAEEGIDEVLQLKEGTGEVRHSPKGGGRNGGAKTTRWSGRAGAATRPRREGREGERVLGRTREGG
jgi:hypothetical protein